ncbi:MAG: caspase family protein [Myxococcota bacterium]
MRSSILWILFVLFVLHASATVAQESTHGHEHKLFAVVIANNASIDAEVAPLRYADDDGARYWELFSSIDNAEVHLLTTLDSESQLLFEGLARQTRPPSQSEVLKTLREVSESIARERARGVRTTLFVVFTGHGAVDDKGTGYLSLLDGPFTRQDLYRNIISPQIADRTHLIIDACNAYFMVRSRDGGGGGDDRSGETYDDEFMQFIQRSDQLSKTPTVGVFVSTAGAAEVHEWSRYRGGVFSHQLRSGLLGAADINGDLKISYQELKAYLAAANASSKPFVWAAT